MQSPSTTEMFSFDLPPSFILFINSPPYATTTHLGNTPRTSRINFQLQPLKEVCLILQLHPLQGLSSIIASNIFNSLADLLSPRRNIWCKARVLNFSNTTSPSLPPLLHPQLSRRLVSAPLNLPLLLFLLLSL